MKVPLARNRNVLRNSLTKVALQQIDEAFRAFLHHPVIYGVRERDFSDQAKLLERRLRDLGDWHAHGTLVVEMLIEEIEEGRKCKVRAIKAASGITSRSTKI